MANTPQSAAAKWRDRLSASTAEIQAGVEAVQVAPGQRAAAQRQAWISRLTASQDKWARNVAAVSLADWQRSMLEVGLPRVAQGAQANVGKVETFLAEFLPHVEAGAAKVRAMPNNSIEDGINRAVAMIRHNAAFQRRNR